MAETGSWYGLIGVLRANEQEFDAYWSNPPSACPVCGEPLTPAQNRQSAGGVQLYCKYAGDHHFVYPRDFHPPVRPGTGAGQVRGLP